MERAVAGGRRDGDEDELDAEVQQGAEHAASGVRRQQGGEPRHGAAVCRRQPAGSLLGRRIQRRSVVDW